MNFDKEINEALKNAGVKLNEDYEENFNDISIGTKLMDDQNNLYVVEDIDTSYGEDKYGQPANYITLSHIINGKKVGGGLGMPSTGLKYIFHKV